MVLKIGSHQRGVLASKDGDVNRGLVFSNDLGLQGQWYVNGAVRGDDPTGVGAGKQHSRWVLIHLERDKLGNRQAKPGMVENKCHINLF
jgi:hypothetical protein